MSWRLKVFFPESSARKVTDMEGIQTDSKLINAKEPEKLIEDRAVSGHELEFVHEMVSISEVLVMTVLTFA